MFWAFDILDYNGTITGNMPLIERKRYLERLIKFENPNFKVLPYLTELEGILSIMKETNAEGIILKEKNSLYADERTDSWLKYKKRIEKVIVFNAYGHNPDNSLTLTDGFHRVKCNYDIERITDEINCKGKITAEVEGLEVTEAGHLRFPILKRII